MVGKLAFELAIPRFTDIYRWDKKAWKGRDKKSFDVFRKLKLCQKEEWWGGKVTTFSL